MKVVFVEEVSGSALVGEVKEVKKGYARNFLLPRGLAVPATKDNLERGERLAQADQIRQGKLDGAAQAVADRIDGAALTMTARVGEQGRLYGSITAAAIAQELTEIGGNEIEHRQVLLGEAIRTVGTQEVRVRLTRNVSAKVSVTVAPEVVEEEEPSIAEVVAAVEAEEAAAEAGESAAAATDSSAASASTDAAAEND